MEELVFVRPNSIKFGVEVSPPEVFKITELCFAPVECTATVRETQTEGNKSSKKKKHFHMT